LRTTPGNPCENGISRLAHPESGRDMHGTLAEVPQVRVRSLDANLGTEWIRPLAVSLLLVQYGTALNCQCSRQE